MEKINKLLAKFYNSLPPKLKLALMVCTSLFISGFVNLLIRDLLAYNETQTNDYIKLIIDCLIPGLTVLLNVAQESSVKTGTRLLAMEGDEQTLSKLNKKVKETQELLSV